MSAKSPRPLLIRAASFASRSFLSFFFCLHVPLWSFQWAVWHPTLQYATNPQPAHLINDLPFRTFFRQKAQESFDSGSGCGFCFCFDDDDMALILFLFDLMICSRGEIPNYAEGLLLATFSFSVFFLFFVLFFLPPLLNRLSCLAAAVWALWSKSELRTSWQRPNKIIQRRNSFNEGPGVLDF